MSGFGNLKKPLAPPKAVPPVRATVKKVFTQRTSESVVLRSTASGSASPAQSKIHFRAILVLVIGQWIKWLPRRDGWKE